MQEDVLQTGLPEERRHLRRRAVGDDTPAGDEHDPLAHPLDLDHVVAGDEQRGAFFGAQPLQTGAHAARDVGIERGGRLVEHEQLRVVQRRLHDADERALPRRELVAHRGAEMRHPEPLEARGRPPVPGRRCRRAGRRGAGTRARAAARERQVAGGEPDLLHGLAPFSWGAGARTPRPGPRRG